MIFLRSSSLVLIFIFCLSCDPVDLRLKIENQTSTFVYYDFSNRPELRENFPFSGFIKILGNDTLLREDYPFIRPDSTVAVELQGNWESYIRESEGDKLYITLFDGDILKKYDWDYIRDKNLFLHKYELSLDALRELDWKIYYTDSLRPSTTPLDH